MEEVSVSVSLSFVVTGQAEHGRGQAQGVVAAVDEIDLKPNKRRDLALGTASSATCDPHPPYTPQHAARRPHPPIRERIGGRRESG